MMAEMTLICFKETDGEKWVAQCLEYDICASADSLGDLPAAFHAALDGHELIYRAEGLEPLASLPKAPARYWKMYQEAVGTYEPRAPQLPVRVSSMQFAPARFALAYA